LISVAIVQAITLAINALTTISLKRVFAKYAATSYQNASCVTPKKNALYAKQDILSTIVTFVPAVALLFLPV